MELKTTAATLLNRGYYSCRALCAALAVFAMLSVFCAQVQAYGMEEVFQQGRVLTRAPVVDNDGHRVMGLYTVVKGDDGNLQLSGEPEPLGAITDTKGFILSGDQVNAYLTRYRRYVANKDHPVQYVLKEAIRTNR